MKVKSLALAFMLFLTPWHRQLALILKPILTSRRNKNLKLPSA